LILVDTSVWIEYLRKTGSPSHLALRAEIEEDRPIAVPSPVIMELLAGATTDEDAERLRDMLASFKHLPVDDLGDFEHAADIQRVCRSHGETVRSLIDCLIAAVAIREDLPMLSANRDFEVIARHTGLKLSE
jgi:predicted nucleic acid-binding protein